MKKLFFIFCIICSFTAKGQIHHVYDFLSTEASYKPVVRKMSINYSDRPDIQITTLGGKEWQHVLNQIVADLDFTRIQKFDLFEINAGVEETETRLDSLEEVLGLHEIFNVSRNESVVVNQNEINSVVVNRRFEIQAYADDSNFENVQINLKKEGGTRIVLFIKGKNFMPNMNKYIYAQLGAN